MRAAIVVSFLVPICSAIWLPEPCSATEVLIRQHERQETPADCSDFNCPTQWVFENAAHVMDRNEADKSSSHVYTTDEVDGFVNGIKGDLQKRDANLDRLTNQIDDLAAKNDALVKRISDLEGKGQ